MPFLSLRKYIEEANIYIILVTALCHNKAKRINFEIMGKHRHKSIDS